MLSRLTMEEGLASSSDVGELTPGFRFAPTEEELITFYLRNKLDCKRQDLNQVMSRLIPDLDIFQFNPGDLPRARNFYDRYPDQWFFFVPRQQSEARGGKPRRVTTTGYWKGTGSPSYVYSSNNRIIGKRRSMVFYIGRAPNGKKTDWKLHEYKAIIQGEASSSTTTTAHPTLQNEFSLCRLYLRKSKYMSSFDRRPVGENQVANLRYVQSAHDSDADATTKSLLVPSMEDPEANLLESLFSEMSSLDRRPVGDDQVANLNNVQPANHNDVDAATKSLQVPLMVDPQANLPERLSLSFQIGETSSSALANGPIWDWEELEDRFYVEQYTNMLLK